MASLGITLVLAPCAQTPSKSEGGAGGPTESGGGDSQATGDSAIPTDSNNTAGPHESGETRSAFAGEGVLLADMDLDGRAEVLVGATHEGASADFGGAVYLLFAADH